MDKFVAFPDAIRRYGDASATMAVNVAGAAAADQAAIMAAVIPVFGLIGLDFLVASGPAVANNLTSAAEVAHVCSATAVVSYETAATHELTEDVSASDFGTISKSL